jgi:hypothetical protein
MRLYLNISLQDGKYSYRARNASLYMHPLYVICLEQIRHFLFMKTMPMKVVVFIDKTIPAVTKPKGDACLSACNRKLLNQFL